MRDGAELHQRMVNLFCYQNGCCGSVQAWSCIGILLSKWKLQPCPGF